MDAQSEITAVKYGRSPSRKVARQLLREIAKRPISFAPRQVDKPLILYGAGNLGRMARDYFARLRIPVLFAVDANPQAHRRDPFWSGVDILGIDDVPAAQGRSALWAVCVVTAPFSQVSGPLKKAGWCDVVPFYDIAEAYRDRHPLSNGWHSGALTEQDLCGIESVLYRWEDDLSRAHHLQFVAWRSLREEWFFDDAPVMTQNRYFIPEVLSILHDHEVFVDIGAHHGEVIERFTQEVRNSFGAVYAVEPDAANLSCLYERLKGSAFSPRERFHVSECALGPDSVSRRFFHGLDYVSQFSDLGQAQVEVRRLDDLRVPATFVKIHVEGWEQGVFSGAMETIVNNRPVLAVTSYHTSEGLWRLPAQMMTCLDRYAYYFRLHSWHGTGGVIYALPRERIAKSRPHYATVQC